ncbi:MAG: RidA family protein [Propionibacteriaceae bacterium]|jgi:reactive intermediate/imine deaminase|nr:RidA family protein [Propionibacteriaceae bacterium]
MAKTVITTTDAPSPGGAYSLGIKAGPFLFTAGFGPHDPVTREVVGADIETQTRQTLANVAAVLAEAGLSLSDVVKTTVHLAELERDFAGFNAAYAEIMPQPWPVRTTVGSGLLGILVEIDVIAIGRCGGHHHDA